MTGMERRLRGEGGAIMRRPSALLILALVAVAGCGGRGPAGDPTTAESPAAGPATGPHAFLSDDGVEIAATVHRFGDPNLVLVHGWMCDQSYWQPQVPALAERFGVVTLDLAGHGSYGSDRGTWTIPSLGADVEAVIEGLGLERVIVVGHSMGGRVALDVARRLPGRVIGVIGVDTLHDADEEVDPAQVERLLAAFEGDFPSACDGFVRGMFAGGAAPELVDEVAADMCSGPGEIGTALLGGYVAFDLQQAFAEAGVPIRAVNADLWPTDETGNREVSDFGLVLLEGYGHFLTQEAPEKLAGALADVVLEIVASASTTEDVRGAAE